MSERFSLKDHLFNESATETIEKHHVIRANASTYSIYPGTHYLVILVNGSPVANASFEVG